VTVPAGEERLDPRAAIEAVPLWYHTIEVAPGLVTPGWFDLRPIVDKMPWPDVRGKRCLDVGTFDGFLAFELERRGAAEVVATDIASHEDWDLPWRLRQRDPQWLVEHYGEQKDLGFQLAKRLLGSSVERVETNVYDLDPEELGEFDVVVCGSLMLHLRDPLRAMQAIRRVCRGQFLSAEQVDLPRSVLHRRRPTFRLDGLSDLFQWFIPNTAGHVRMVEAAGFDVRRTTGPYCIAFGASHPPREGVEGWALAAGRWLVTRGDGVPTHAALADASSAPAG
jgi:tRNA (mo5U34)-methyltransferase